MSDRDFVKDLKVGDMVLVQTYGLGAGIYGEFVSKVSGTKRIVIVLESGKTFDQDGRQKKRSQWDLGAILLPPTLSNKAQYNESRLSRLLVKAITTISLCDKTKLTDDQRHQLIVLAANIKKEQDRD